MAAIANLPAEVSVKEDVLQSDSKSLRCAGGLEFKDVTLKYSDEAEPALDRVSFKISPGRKVGSKLYTVDCCTAADTFISLRKVWIREEYAAVLLVSSAALE